MPHPLLERNRLHVMRYRFIGDTLLTVPFLRNLRNAYPNAKIDMLVGPHSGEVLRDCPYIDELIEFDTSRKHHYENSESKPKTFFSYVNLLKERQYDTAFVLKRSFSSAALAMLAGIPERIGFNTEGRGWLLTRRVAYEPDQHEIDSFLRVLEAVQIPVNDRYLEAWWQPAEEAKIDGLLPSSNVPQVVLHLTSSNRAKEWPRATAQKLLQWLLFEKKCQVHCLGAASDSPIYQELRQVLPSTMQDHMHIHCGTLSLLESMAFLKRMQLVVGVDSGTLHMASAVQAPVVALFGPMNEHKWAPPNATVVTEPVACRPCNLKVPCRFDFKCMKQLSLEAVKSACQKHLSY